MRAKIVVFHLLLVLIQSSDGLEFSAIGRGVKSFTAGAKGLISDRTDQNCLGLPKVMEEKLQRAFTKEAKPEDVQFYFHSRRSRNGVTVRVENTSSLDNLDYNVGKDTAFITHGFWSSGKEDWVKNMTNALLRLSDMNVVVVDWEKGSHTLNYASASLSTRIVGAQIAKLLGLIDTKVSESNEIILRRGKLHLIGHSLGSHISAHAAFLIKTSLKWSVDRITGLDPAQPCFTSANESLKLDREDADFVDVIHTNANRILLGGLGLQKPLGHIDFYPNGGKIQLGCGTTSESNSFWSSFTHVLKFPVDEVKKAVCSHGRSYEFFTDSINVKMSRKCDYYGYKWDRSNRNVRSLISRNCEQSQCPKMGIEAADYKGLQSDIFYVPTGDKAPYCQYTKENVASMERQLNQDEEVENSFVIKTASMLTG
ncbi:hypothetical protein QAD02_008512 [Eretmocerus hayati]|uniref:Uncharacterized protein n=1 Tax=Eretmocerus hayati TaxID=131215 RepID=A0ACC2N6M5_9HYME|nr:hypothetical protein QAD02_008512 [Eretmocerus hayati]